jgi:hypothetical protein
VCVNYFVRVKIIITNDVSVCCGILLLSLSKKAKDKLFLISANESNGAKNA